MISDYTTSMPAILPGHPDLVSEKYIQLGGNPWSSDDLATRENLKMSIITCLTKNGYKLSMDINMDATSKVFFFIRDTEICSAEVLIPDLAKLGVGDYSRPWVVRSRSGKTNSMIKRVRCSLRKKVAQANHVMSYKPRMSEPAWWEQASTDMSGEQGEEG